MDLLVGFTVLLVLLYTLYWYLTRNHNYWKERGIPYVPPVPIFGSQYGMFGRPVQDEEMDRYKKYGRLYGFYEGPRPALTVADPDLLRDILVKEFQFFTGRRNFTAGDDIIDSMVSIVQGEKWKRVRTIITPAFTTGKIRRMTSMILDSAKTLCENFRKSNKDGQPIDAKRLFGAFTMDVIATSAFATKVDSHNDPDNKFVAAARQMFNRNVPWRFIIFICFPQIFRFFRIPAFSMKPINFFKTVTMRVIEERKKSGQVHNDFLQLLMDASDEQKRNAVDTEEYKDDEVNETYFKPSSEFKELSENEVIAQCILFFLAGYDTTASTLSFACYLLALNPECQERLIEDIDTALSNYEGKLTYEAVQSMKYLDCVVSETLRLFPPATRLEREADEDYELGHTGLTIPKGMLVGVPTYAMHRDPEFFPDPEKFDPERFNSEAKAERNQYTYLPFGAGPRNCLGMRFALMEIKICLAEVFSQFRIKRGPKTKVPLEFYMGQGLLQPKEILLYVEERTQKFTEK